MPRAGIEKEMWAMDLWTQQGKETVRETERGTFVRGSALIETAHPGQAPFA